MVRPIEAPVDEQSGSQLVLEGLFKDVGALKIHLKRDAAHRGSLCGRFPVHSFCLIRDLAKLSEEQRCSICKICLKAAEST